MASNMRSLRKRAEAKLEGLDVQQPFGLENLCLRLAECRGRPVHLRAIALRARASGAWLATDRADYVFYEKETSAFHQEHIILHEIGHMLADHKPVTIIADDVSQLLTHLDPALVGRILTRTGYSTNDEQEAEIFSSTVHRQLRGASRYPAVTAREVQTVLLRLESAMGNSE